MAATCAGWQPASHDCRSCRLRASKMQEEHMYVIACHLNCSAPRRCWPPWQIDAVQQVHAVREAAVHLRLQRSVFRGGKRCACTVATCRQPSLSRLNWGQKVVRAPGRSRLSTAQLRALPRQWLLLHRRKGLCSWWQTRASTNPSAVNSNGGQGPWLLQMHVG